MSITTKAGDRGWTSLLFNRRVRKTDVRVQALGALDELTSFLGLAKTRVRRKWVKNLIHSCQRDLYVVCAEIAALPGKLPRPGLRVDRQMIERLDEETRKLEKRLDPRTPGFITPGDTETSALLDVCRAVARRAERQVIMIRRRITVAANTLKYLNRLSDLLYLLARAEEKRRKPPQP